MTISYRIMVVMNMILLIMAVSVSVSPQVNAVNVRKLDDTTVGSPNDEIKCGDCPCGTTCYSSPPPPKPSPPPPSPPPPPKKQTPTPVNCPPPPCRGGCGGGGGHAPPDYIYITGPPGDLYPVVQSVNAAHRWSTVTAPVLVVAGLLGMLAFW
ncbi:hypothetical protein HanRHA438_Chr12g0560811 [Helianthus annuus]|nr:hypothetical protein HanHA300_Chr12g0450241 [Helianthus annuus]KAJ0675576.1 hypothetical protein HanLR1_Chr12g0452721 [Helianthus annuus]KAJ0678853.1 hypothetical protein HanOQP8_Chr12g0452601 [Helianthus annuus]KAJ0867234.1 hypothetical protein HanRHA438_Chr12g0560811 [Helianthus annuus]